MQYIPVKQLGGEAMVVKFLAQGNNNSRKALTGIDSNMEPHDYKLHGNIHSFVQLAVILALSLSG